MRTSVLLALVASCALDRSGLGPEESRVDGGGTDAGTGSIDAGPGDARAADDSGRVSDSGPTVDASVPLGPWGTPTMIAELAHDEDDDDPTLTADELEMYFDSARSGVNAIWVTRRSDTSLPWGAPAPVVELASSDWETAPEVSADGLQIWFSSGRPGGTDPQNIWTSTRRRRTDPWDPPTFEADVSSGLPDSSPAPTPDLLRMVVGRDRGSWDLFETSRVSERDPWMAPVPIASLNTTAEDESNGYFDPTGLMLYFDGIDAMRNAQDLYVATRPALDMPFGAAAPLSELNSVDQEHDPWVSADGRHVVFVSNRSGNYEIWEAFR